MAPTFSISTSTTSPSLSQGFLPPLDSIVPIGVPVEIMSPGSRVITLLSFDIISSTRNTMFPVVESCRVSPFTLVHILRLFGSETSDLVVIHGPHGAKVSKHLL